MLYYSTNHKSAPVSLREAVLRGLPDDNGLYMPQAINQVPEKFIKQLPDLSFQEIALQVARTLLREELDDNMLRSIIEEAINFDAPLVEVKENCYTLELFHGPTLAFKDFAARFMAKLMGYYVRHDNRELTILVATSGDTGSAVANGFLKVPGIRVVLLYPAGKVSEIQERQLTTLGHNITALKVAGTFDDCQRMVKTAFLDSDLQECLFLTSANSINIARLIPQTFYYFRAISQLPSPALPAVVSVPSGNFGNLTAGLMARRMGLPIKDFVAATNINDVVPEYLHSGRFAPRPSERTLSNAMDVGNPSNFARMLALFDNDAAAMRKEIHGYAFTDAQTTEKIREIFRDFDYVLDPHGAVGLLGLEAYLNAHNHPRAAGIFFETAHPAKFKEIVEEAIDAEIALPEALEEPFRKTPHAIPISKEYNSLKDILTSL